MNEHHILSYNYYLLMIHPKFLVIPFFAVLILSSCSRQKSNNPRNLSKESERIESVIKEATFKDVEGNDITISDFSGKVVLIDFWKHGAMFTSVSSNGL